MLEKSNTWPEQVLDTLNSCWRALLESLSNTQANVRRWSLDAALLDYNIFNCCLLRDLLAAAAQGYGSVLAVLV